MPSLSRRTDADDMHDFYEGDSDDSWLDAEDFEDTVQAPQSCCNDLLSYMRRRRLEMACFVIGILCILAGALVLTYNFHQPAYLYRELFFFGAACISGILSDLFLMVLQVILEHMVDKAAKNKHKNLSYQFTWLTFYFSTARSALGKLIWTVLVLVAVVVVVPRNADGTVTDDWAVLYYHSNRILRIIALWLISRIISKLLRQWLAQDFGLRSFRPRIRESFAHEDTILKLRGSEESPIFRQLYNHTRTMSKDGDVNLQIWQTLMQYVISHHVDGREPRTGKHSVRVSPQHSAGLVKRARPIAIQIFARIITKVDELNFGRNGLAIDDDARSVSPNFLTDGANMHEPDTVLDFEEHSSSVTLTKTMSQPIKPVAKPDPPALAGQTALPLRPIPTIPQSAGPTVNTSSAEQPLPATKKNLQFSSASQKEDASDKLKSSASPTSAESRQSAFRKSRRKSMLKRQRGVHNLRKDQTAMSDVDFAADTKRLSNMVKSFAKSDTRKPSRGLFHSDKSLGSKRSSVSTATDVSSRVILQSDFVEAFSRSNPSVQWDKLWKRHLDPRSTGFITWQRFRKRFLGMYEFRYNLALTILDSNAVVNSMDVLIMSFMMVIVAGIGMSMYSKNWMSLFTSFGTVIVGYSFIFGSSVQECFDNVIFLFSMHPYDVGDIVMIDDRRLQVARIRLMTTDFVRNDGAFFRKSNKNVRASNLINLSTSKNHCQDFSTLVPALDVTHDFMQELQKDIDNFVAQHPDMFESVTLYLSDLVHPLTTTGRLGANGSHPTHMGVHFWVAFAFTLEEIMRVLSARNAFLIFLGDTLHRLGVLKPVIVPGDISEGDDEEEDEEDEDEEDVDDEHTDSGHRSHEHHAHRRHSFTHKLLAGFTRTTEDAEQHLH